MLLETVARRAKFVRLCDLMLCQQRIEAETAPVPVFDLDTYLSDSNVGYRLSAEPIDLVLRVEAFAAPDLVERPLAPDQVVGDGPGGDGEVIVEARVHDSMELRAFLLSLGSDAEVLGPPHLRDAIAADLRRALAPYRTRRGPPAGWAT